MLKLATWNVNSLKVRLEHVLTWIENSKIDILALQETKLRDENFPRTFFEDKGYHLLYSGQKMFNGVALISRLPITETIFDIPNLEDPQRRILVATVAGIRLINLYVPNGGDLSSEKYPYKLNWLKKVTDFIKQQMLIYPKLAVVGDFNIAPEDRDVAEIANWQNSVLVSPCEREAFVNLLSLGLADSFRNFTEHTNIYSWWDYRGGSFRRNLGLRIDHILLSQDLNAMCTDLQIDKTPRSWERPSDHAPVWAEFYNMG